MPEYLETLGGLAVPRSWPTNGHARPDENDGWMRVGMSEALTALETEDIGWLREGAYTDRDFSVGGLKRIRMQARLSYLKNPLIQRGVKVQAFYVFGLGLDIRAPDDQVNAVVQAFLADKHNQSELTSHEARVAKEIELQVTGNLFFCFFSKPASGKVRVRTIPVDEILSIVTNPDDAKESWYYKREYVRVELDSSNGALSNDVTVEYYPDWRYHPDVEPATINGKPVHWETPVYHVKVGCLADMRFGVPEVYAALDWARAVKSDLEDYATTKRALSRFAWNMTTKGGVRGVAAAKTKLSTTVGTNGGEFGETNPPPTTGSVFIGGESTQMQPMRVAGSQPNPDEGRRLWLMVASAMGLPETFFGEASVGSHATAKTLDRPTELKMRDRQILWVDIFKDILEYVVEKDVAALGGILHGTVSYDEDGRRVVDLGVDAEGQPINPLVEVTFPPLLDREIIERVKSIVSALTLDGNPSAGTFDKRTAIQLLLQALGEDDIDEMLDRLAPIDGEPLLPPHDPNAPPPQPFGVPPGTPTTQPGTGSDNQAQGKQAAQEAKMSEAMVEAVRELRAALKKVRN